MTDGDITLRTGMALGTITHAKQQDKCSIAEMAPMDVGPTTRIKKKEEYICNFVKDAKDKRGKEKKLDTNISQRPRSWNGSYIAPRMAEARRHRASRRSLESKIHAATDSITFDIDVSSVHIRKRTFLYPGSTDPEPIPGRHGRLRSMGGKNP